MAQLSQMVETMASGEGGKVYPLGAKQKVNVLLFKKNCCQLIFIYSLLLLEKIFQGKVHLLLGNVCFQIIGHI